MNALDTLLEPIRHSPRLIEAVDLLQKEMDDERRRREQFYEEMTEEHTMEFINGEVIRHSPSRRDELEAARHLLMVLDTHVRRHKLGEVFSAKCLCVFPRNDYEPDIVFFGPGKAAHFHPHTDKFPIPDLAVEVLSESTEQRDQGVKFEDYAARGVDEYWIIDAEARILDQYRLTGDRYETVQKASEGELRSEVVESFVIPITAIFDESENLKALRRIVS